MVSPIKGRFLDKTIGNLWRAWDEFSSSTINYISGKPRPELPKDDLEKLMLEIEECIQGIGDEASLRSRAAEIGQVYLELNQEGRSRFLVEVATRFNVDRREINEAAANLLEVGSEMSIRIEAEEKLKNALEPRWRSLLGRFTTLPEGVKFLVDMRAEMFSVIKKNAEVETLSNDLKSMLSAWFDIGLLELVQIEWGSPATLLEKLIAYESVHAIRSWDDLKNRLGSDRRCFGFFHPNMPNEPLIFVQVALVEGISDNIGELLDESKPAIDPKDADTAIFYSISNAQRGLDGISFGNFLIKQVVEKLNKELPNLKTFSTLSPIPGFSNWLVEQLENDSDILLTPSDRKLLRQHSSLENDAALLTELIAHFEKKENLAQEIVMTDLERPLMRLAVEFLCEAKGRQGRARDPVAHFHLSNGASIERLNWAADISSRGTKQSYGIMVNYRYRLKEIQENSSAYGANKSIAYSAAVRSILRS